MAPEEDYMCDLADGLFSPHNFCDTPVEMLRCYQQHHDNHMANLTTGCWETATPKAELIVIQERVNNIVQRLIGETAPFGMDVSFQA